MRSLLLTLPIICSCSWIFNPLFDDDCTPETPPHCEGDLVVTCENGVLVSNPCENGCNPTRNDCSFCGDNSTDTGEDCDDGNLLNGDGCTNTCLQESCGDGAINNNRQTTLPEQCDDQNTISGDGCTELCQVEFCGDGVNNNALGVFATEQCDGEPDCSPSCKLQLCGNGVLDPGEECDDANIFSSDGCEHDCTLPACGNNFLDLLEGCDDGNLTNNDGCSSACQSEATAACGNNIIEANEFCGFATPILLDANGALDALQVADFDHDGLLDFAFVNRAEQGSIQHLRQTAPRVYAPLFELTGQIHPTSLTLADFNFDARLDLAWIEQLGQTRNVKIGALNVANGLDLIANITVDIEPNAIIDADFDEDGFPDLAVTCTNGDNINGNINVILAADQISAQPIQEISGLESNPGHLLVVDVNRDNHQDLVLESTLPIAIPKLHLLLGNGDGTFQTRQEFPLARVPIQMSAADLNNDDTPDLVISNSPREHVTVFLGAPQGSLQEVSPTPSLAGDVGLIALGDLNKDGALDLLATLSNNLLGAFFGDGAGHFGSLNNIPTPFGLGPLQLADLDNDGVLDLAAIVGSQITIFYGLR